MKTGRFCHSCPELARSQFSRPLCPMSDLCFIIRETHVKAHALHVLMKITEITLNMCDHGTRLSTQIMAHVTGEKGET